MIDFINSAVNATFPKKKTPTVKSTNMPGNSGISIRFTTHHFLHK